MFKDAGEERIYFEATASPAFDDFGRLFGYIVITKEEKREKKSKMRI